MCTFPAGREQSSALPSCFNPLPQTSVPYAVYIVPCFPHSGAFRRFPCFPVSAAALCSDPEGKKAVTCPGEKVWVQAFAGVLLTVNPMLIDQLYTLNKVSSITH